MVKMIKYNDLKSFSYDPPPPPPNLYARRTKIKIFVVFPEWYVYVKIVNYIQ